MSDQVLADFHKWCNAPGIVTGQIRGDGAWDRRMAFYAWSEANGVPEAVARSAWLVRHEWLTQQGLEPPREPFFGTLDDWEPYVNSWRPFANRADLCPLGNERWRLTLDGKEFRLRDEEGLVSCCGYAFFCCKVELDDPDTHLGEVLYRLLNLPYFFSGEIHESTFYDGELFGRGSSEKVCLHVHQLLKDKGIEHPLPHGILLIRRQLCG